MEKISVLDVGAAIIGRTIMVLMGFTCAPLLLALWALYVLLFLYLGIPAFLVRAVFPGTAPWINIAFDKSFGWVIRFSIGFVKVFFFRVKTLTV